MVFLACVLVGTVIVASLRILTVMDRRGEIAIRRVEGATVLEIATQFTLETVAFCLMGAVAGMPLGIFLAWLRTKIDPSSAVTWVFPLRESVVTVATILLMSILAGLLPAFRAARVEPVEILGRE